MMKKYLKLLIILFCSINNCYASFWDDIAECLNNPCNCGHGTKYERWNGATIDRGDENLNCPPYDRGRPENTCLMQFDYPGNFTPWYLNYCAEHTPQSDYFSPRIKVRYQACNFFACWTNDATLDWDGQCVLWPTGYAIPTLRICARLANPESVINDSSATVIPADPGYDPNFYLDSQGNKIPDKLLVTANGGTLKINKPKLCAYKDPSLIDTVTAAFSNGLDMIDFNPTRQILHRSNGDLHPIAKVLIFLIEQAQGTGLKVADLLDGLLNKVSIEEATENIEDEGLETGAILIGSPFFMVVHILKSIVQLIEKIIEFIGDGLVQLLKEVGQFNRVVDETLGCVELPEGPFPPPYCPFIAKFKPTASTQAICPSTVSNNVRLTVVSKTDSECVVSKLTNNLISNSIRVTVDNFVPLCRGSEKSDKGKCVKIRGTLANSASNIHALSSFRDVVRKCSASTSDTNCIETSIQEPVCRASDPTMCENGFRIVYSLRIGRHAVPSRFFVHDVSDCNSASSGKCQEIWGVNTGTFIDVPVIFPQREDVLSVGGLSKAFNLDVDGKTTLMSASIQRISTKVGDDFMQEPRQICVFAGQKLIGCENRVPMNEPNKDSNQCSLQNTKYSTACVNNGEKCKTLSGRTINFANVSNDVCKFIGNLTSCTQTSDDRVKCYDVNNNCKDAPEFCIMENNQIVNCKERVCKELLGQISCISSNAAVKNTCEDVYAKPKLYKCDSNEAISIGLSCPGNDVKSNYFSPKFTMLLESGDNRTGALLEPLSLQNKDSTKYSVNLAGYLFKATATDDTLIQKPFPISDRSISPTSIYGKYKAGKDGMAVPYITQPDGSIVKKDGIYLSNIEYHNDHYVRGGKWVCVQTDNFGSCSYTNTKNCVLTKLLNTEVIDCNTFLYQLYGYRNLHLCTSLEIADTECKDFEILQGKNGGAGITIKKCATTDCYTHSQNVELCKVSFSNSDRIEPAPKTNGFNTLNSNEYYDLTEDAKLKYEKSLYVTRSKTNLELGLCIPIQQPKCSAISYISVDHGNAKWTEAAVGEISTGTCEPGSSSSAPLTRYCLADLSNESSPQIKFEKLTEDQLCVKKVKIAFANTSTFPSLNFPIKEGIGIYEFGKDQSNQLMVGHKNVKYTSSLKFNIGNLSKVKSFIISKVGYDDYVKVSVNGSFLVGTSNIDQVGGETGEYKYLNNIDIKSKLKQGDNNILFELKAYDGANLYYRIEYDFRQ